MVDSWASSGSASTSYYHGNLIGTTRLMSDSGGDGVNPAAYTAFGERISGSMGGPEDRYGYAGAWGYQAHDFPSGDPIPFVHVGARYYDPASGRFLQRDPIGIAGGLNIYVYMFSNPALAVDPAGLRTDMGWDEPPGGYPKPPPAPRYSRKPRPRPQYRDSMWDRFWLDPFWHWLDDPRKVRRVRVTAKGVYSACAIWIPGGWVVKVGKTAVAGALWAMELL
jgi:RHS repeat-associated protein